MDNLFKLIKSVLSHGANNTDAANEARTKLNVAIMGKRDTAYFWVITVDNQAERFEPQGTNQNAVGQSSPVGPNTGNIILEYQPQPFRLVDDDGRIAYEGIYWGPDDETLFAPLEDFGAPNVGCTEIWHLETQKPNAERNFAAGMTWKVL
jgi:hypothetical protein